MDLYNVITKGIKPVNEEAKLKALKRQDNLFKPLGSLGELEELSIKLAGITGNVYNTVDKKCIVIMASDNGVCEEGVSSCPQEITAKQTINFIKGTSGVGVLARHAKADLRVVDIGINADINYHGIIKKKIRKGTSNMAKGPAMQVDEAIKAIEIGMGIVEDLVKEGYELLGTGEMGIGNTSTSSAILMSFTGCTSDIAIGKGAGMTDEGFINKKHIIEKSIEVNNPNSDDPIDVLAKVGGFDIAGLTGCFLAAAYYRVPIVIDGFISAAAALTAYKINPLVKEYMIASHKSKEPGYLLIMKELGLCPVLHMGMRLGEGTGCALVFNIIEAATKIINEMVTFEQAEIDTAYLIDIR